MLHAVTVLLADDPVAKGPVEGPPPWASLVPIILMFGAFYFLLILPAQRRERKQRETLMSALKKNDEVVTSSGIIGVVQTIKESDEVVLKIDDNARIRVLKSSILRILPKETPAAPPTA